MYHSVRGVPWVPDCCTQMAMLMPLPACVCLSDSYKVLCSISLEKPVSFNIWFACKLYIHVWVGSSIAIVTMLMCIAVITIKVLRHLQLCMWSIMFEPIFLHIYTAGQICLSIMVRLRLNFHAGYGIGITLVSWLTTWLGLTFASMSIKLSSPVSHKLRSENLAIKFMQPMYHISSIRCCGYYFHRCTFQCGYYSRAVFISLGSLLTSMMTG